MMMNSRSIVCNDGSTLEYFVSDRSGPTVLCVNAIGLGLSLWERVLDGLAASYRVICWSPRGTYGRICTLQDQVADLERIVASEQIAQCRLVTWCSGAKVGIEFFQRNPIVSSIVFMNGAYASLSGLEHCETPFEQTLLKLCQLVVRRPALAGMMMNSMRALLTGDASGPQGAASPLDGVTGDRSLRAALVEPFATEQSTINYSYQVVDYMGRDIAPRIAAVTAPALLIAGQRDSISAPAMSKVIAARLPRAEYAEIANGTHYGLYENPDVVLGLIERFFRASADGEARPNANG